MSDLTDTFDLIDLMNASDVFFLALAAATIVALVIILARPTRDLITPPSVPLQRIGKAPHYRLPRSGGALLEALVVIAFCGVIAAALVVCLSDLDIMLQR